MKMKRKLWFIFYLTIISFLWASEPEPAASSIVIFNFEFQCNTDQIKSSITILEFKPNYFVELKQKPKELLHNLSFVSLDITEPNSLNENLRYCNRSTTNLFSKESETSSLAIINKFSTPIILQYVYAHSFEAGRAIFGFQRSLKSYHIRCINDARAPPFALCNLLACSFRRVNGQVIQAKQNTNSPAV